MSKQSAFSLRRDDLGPFEMHEHHFVSGPRSTAGYRNGVWCETKFSHSHPGGGVAHTHPNTGPSYFGHGKPKVTKKPKGEQMEFIPRTDEENTFDLVITDSARYFNEKNEHVLVGDMPLENMSMFAAETVKGAFRMKCNVRDERKHVRKAGGDV